MARNEKRANTFARPYHPRSIGRKIIIVCEGAKTEVGYFEDIRKSLGLSTKEIIVKKPEGSDPLTIVQWAIDKRDNQVYWAEEEGDQAWAVYDGDEHIVNNKRNWNEAMRLAEKEKIQLAISNPCFEYWYLLHYQEQNANLPRQKARERLKEHLPNYEKSDVLYRSALAKRTEAAIERAQQVAHLAEANQVDCYENPCTHVWKLVQGLLTLRTSP